MYSRFFETHFSVSSQTTWVQTGCTLLFSVAKSFHSLSFIPCFGYFCLFLSVASNTKLLTSASSSPPRSRQCVATQTWNSSITFTQGTRRTAVQNYAINTDNGSLLSCSDELPPLLWVFFCWPSFVGSPTSERPDELGAAAIARSIFVVDKSVSGLGYEFDSHEAYRA